MHQLHHQADRQFVLYNRHTQNKATGLPPLEDEIGDDDTVAWSLEGRLQRSLLDALTTTADQKVEDEEVEPGDEDDKEPDSLRVQAHAHYRRTLGRWRR